MSICRPTQPCRKAPPQTDERIFLLPSPRLHETAPTETAPLYFVGRLPATKYCGAAKTRARYRTGSTETSIFSDSLTGLASEAPDNSRKMPVGKCQVYEGAAKKAGGAWDMAEAWLADDFATPRPTMTVAHHCLGTRGSAWPDEFKALRGTL